MAQNAARIGQEDHVQGDLDAFQDAVQDGEASACEAEVLVDGLPWDPLVQVHRDEEAAFQMRVAFSASYSADCLMVEAEAPRLVLPEKLEVVASGHEELDQAVAQTDPEDEDQRIPFRVSYDKLWNHYKNGSRIFSRSFRRASIDLLHLFSKFRMFLMIRRLIKSGISLLGLVLAWMLRTWTMR